METINKYRVYEVNCNREGRTIVGKLYLPEKEGTYPAVIISHGFGGTYEDTEKYAKWLVEANVGCYVFDFCGGSPCSKSDGSMTTMSVLTEQEDLDCVLHSIKAQEWVKKDQIYLMGESQGGMVSALLAEKRKEEIAGLILIYPALVIPDDARKRFAAREEIPELVTTFGRELGKVYYDAVIDMDIWQEIGTYPREVLLIHGTADELVPISYSEKAADLYSSAKLVKIEGAGHGFSEKEVEAASRVIKEYIKKQGNK